jgi:predicted nucleic acid-binding protein
VRYLIDSDWLIDVYVGVPAAAAIADSLTNQGIGVSIVSYGELFKGAFPSPDSQARLARYRALLERFELLPLSDPIMEIFGRTRSGLRRTGMLIPDLDLLIAATAIHHHLILLTRNLRHFQRIPELQLYPVS